MASTFSTNLAIELIGTGDQAGTWGTTTNSNLGTLIEQAISGYVTQAVATGTDTTITIPNGSTGVARNMYIELTGTGGASTNLIVPANKKLYFIFNNSTGAVTVKVSGQTGVSVPTGKKMVLVSNGTDIVNGLNYIADFGTNSFSVTNLTASSGTITNLIATSGSITNLVSSDASATVLRAGSATLTHLSATSATITNLTLTSLVISNLSIASANITTLTGSTQTLSGNLTLSGGTANGVLYLNGSKVATSGTALVFDGTSIGMNSPTVYGTRSLNSYTGTTASAIGFSQQVAGFGDTWVGSNNSGSSVLGMATGTFGQSTPNNIPWTVSAFGSEQMRLTSTGLGIGTASPVARLDVFKTSNDTVSRTNAVGAFGDYASLGAGLLLQQTLSSPYGFALQAANAANSVQFPLLLNPSGGNVGIGTASPVTKLNVASAAGSPTGVSVGGIRVYETTNNYGLNIGGDGTYGYIQGVRGTTSTTGYNDLVLQPNSGNLGLGVTPSAWGSTWKALQISNWVSLGAETSTTGECTLLQNAYASGASTFNYIGSFAATRYTLQNSVHKWFTAPSGTAGNAISFTQAMTLDASGNLLVGTTTNSEGAKLKVDNGYVFIKESGGADVYLRSAFTGGIAAIQVASNSALAFVTNNTESARITSGGDLLVGVTTGSYHILRKAVTNDGGNTTVEFQSTGGSTSQIWYGVSGFNANAANAATKVGRDATTLRSINAGGTVNASGADYAEYMTKAGDFALAKGDVCGIDADGKLTNVFANAISFVVKSTDPSYVGGDSWGAEFKDDPEGLEAARQKVDRIAFAGQVPVNVLGATPGQYIVPINDNGAIKGVAVSNPTFEQYQSAVGKVIAVQDDGRALIIVKVA